MNIYDNPNHPQYGPVRRMWMIFTQLDLLRAAEHCMPGWDRRLAEMIVEGNPESAAQRATLRVALGMET